ncbi:MAG: radical SAM protein [Candidatus Thorarchaeota archaeon]
MFLAISKLKLSNAENILKSFTYGPYYLKHKIRIIPIGVNYDLTWQCNLSCKHCYFNASLKELINNPARNRKILELSDENWIKIFNYHRNMGIRSASLTGGELTLRMGLIEKAIKIFLLLNIFK